MTEQATNTALQRIAKSAVGSFVEGGNTLGFVNPFANSIKVIEHTRIASTSNVPGIDSSVKSLNVGDKLNLVRESGNLQDEYAVRIETLKHEHLGYLPCDSNELIAHMLDGGKIFYAEVLSKETIGPWHKIDIAVYLDD